MFPIVPLTTTAFVIAGMLVLVALSVRLLQPAYWRSRAVKALVVLTFGTLAFGLGLWAMGQHLHRWPMVTDGAGLTYIGVLTLAPAACVIPITAVLDRAVLRWGGRRDPSAGDETKAGGRLSRRGLMRASVGSLPLAAAATGASGFASARGAPRMPVVRMRYEGLHPDLEGFRILHLSDVHLGACVYLHDIAHVRPLYDASPVPLLVADGRTLQVGAARLYVGGADDPVFMDEGATGRIEPLVAAAARHAPAHADFRLLLCHRPEAHGPAAAHGFDLTLAGHTHGGQVGLLGRSLLEHVRPGIGWWGSYARTRPATVAAQRSVLRASPSRLYTTSGFGHWFPFRLGCPTELPLVVLEGAPRARRIASSPA